MLRSVILVDLAIQQGLLAADAAHKLLAAHPRGPNQPRFEDWATENNLLSKDAAQKLVQAFTQTQFVCMSCMTVVRGGALDGETDLRCPQCHRSALKRTNEAAGKRPTTSKTVAPGAGGSDGASQPVPSTPVPSTPVPSATPAGFAQTKSPGAKDDPTGRMLTSRSGDTTRRGLPTAGNAAAGTPAPAAATVTPAGTTDPTVRKSPTPPNNQIRIELENRPGIAADAKTVILNPAMSAVQPGPKAETTSYKKGTPSERASGRIGNWDTLELAGQGGMGKVYKCYNPVLDRYAAVKVLENEKEKAIKRFRHEARTLARLDHPNVVRIFDYGELEGKPYIVMEWVDGRTLYQMVSSQGAMPALQVIDIGLQICGALALAHELNIVHRDIKPENILLDIHGRVKITDFGLATQDLGNNRITAPGTILGTPAYMAPEQIQQELGTGKTEVYALSVLLFYLLTGREPFEGNNAKVMHLHLSSPFPLLGTRITNPAPGFDELLKHMSAKRPADRMRSMIDVAQSLHMIRRALDASLPEHERLNIVGRLGSPEGVAILETVAAWRNAGIRKIIIDLSQCSYLSSSALARLGVFADDFDASGGRVVLTGAPDHAKLVVNMLAAQHKVRVTSAFDEALAVV